MPWVLHLHFPLWTHSTLCARGCCFGTVPAGPVEAADAPLTCRHPHVLGAVVRLSSALPCSRAVLCCTEDIGVCSPSPPHQHSWAGQHLVIIHPPICCQPWWEDDSVPCPELSLGTKLGLR